MNITNVTQMIKRLITQALWMVIAGYALLFGGVVGLQIGMLYLTQPGTIINK